MNVTMNTGRVLKICMDINTTYRYNINEYIFIRIVNLVNISTVTTSAVPCGVTAYFHDIASLPAQTCNATCIHYKIAEECGCMYQRNFMYYTKEQRNKELPPCDKNRTCKYIFCKHLRCITLCISLDNFV